jgi:hypothetical protein
MSQRGELEGPHDQVAVELGLVRLELSQKLVDEILVPLDYRHPHILPPGSGDPPADFVDRKVPAEREDGPSMMIRRCREARRLRLAARLLLSIGR